MTLATFVRKLLLVVERIFRGHEKEQQQQTLLVIFSLVVRFGMIESINCSFFFHFRSCVNIQLLMGSWAGRCSILQSCTKIWINLTAVFHFLLLVKNGTLRADNLNMEHSSPTHLSFCHICTLNRYVDTHHLVTQLRIISRGG